MPGSTPTLGLGPSTLYCPMADNLATDPLSASIQAGIQGGSATTDYFNNVDNMRQLYQQLGASGRDAWSDATDDTNISAPVKYVAMDDISGNSFYIKVSQEGVNQDDNGNLNLNGTTRTINGVTYNGVGTLSMECGWTNYTFSKTSWWLGTSIGGLVVASQVLPALFSLIKTVANVLADKIKAMAAKGDTGGDPEEEDEEEEDSGGDTDIVTEEGGDVIIEESVEEGAIAIGDVFIGVGIALAIIFIALSFVLHSSYHRIRLWNLTEYDLDWTLHFDTSQAEDQGQLVNGPVVFNSDNSVKTYATILPISRSSPVPGTKPVNQCHFADFNINSSHEFSGIGYVLQYYLKDKSGNVQYTATMYFDIPFKGNNSTNCTMQPQSDLQAYYNSNNGNNKSTLSTANTDDGVITVTTTYDYLSGEHPIPNAPQGGSSNQAYYYQSLICLQQNNIPPSLNATVNAPIEDTAALSKNAAPLHKSAMLQGLRPDLRKQFKGALGLQKQQATKKAA